MTKQVVILKGNELGWLIRLAEEHLMSKGFQIYLKESKIQGLNPFLNELLAKFHPANFRHGSIDVTWVLTEKEESGRKWNWTMKNPFKKEIKKCYCGNPIAEGYVNLCLSCIRRKQEWRKYIRRL